MPLEKNRNVFDDNILRALNAEEVNILRRLLHRMNQQVPIDPPTPQPTEVTSPYNEGGYGTDIYVALTPHYGIPAATIVTAGQLQPGVADNCQIYSFMPTSPIGTTAGNAAGSYFAVYDFTKRIFNIALTDIPGNAWVIVQKDMYGDWVAIQPGTTSEDERLFTHIVDSPTVGTAYTVLYTDTIPAGTFDHDGDVIVAEYAGDGVITSGFNSIRFTLGGNDSTFTMSNIGGVSWSVSVNIIRRSNTELRYKAAIMTGGNVAGLGLFTSSLSPVNLTTTGYPIKVQAQCTGGDTLTARYGYGEKHPV